MNRMKIDEGCINHNAVRMIKDLVESRYDMIIGEGVYDTIESPWGTVMYFCY